MQTIFIYSRLRKITVLQQITTYNTNNRQMNSKHRQQSLIITAEHKSSAMSLCEIVRCSNNQQHASDYERNQWRRQGFGVGAQGPAESRSRAPVGSRGSPQKPHIQYTIYNMQLLNTFSKQCIQHSLNDTAKPPTVPSPKTLRTNRTSANSKTHPGGGRVSTFLTMPTRGYATGQNKND